MFEEERIGEYIKQIKDLVYSESICIDGFVMAKCSGDVKPSPDTIGNLEYTSIEPGAIWGGNNEYFVFKGKVSVPDSMDGKKAVFSLETGKEGEWDATNPQFTVYVNGKLRMGFDTNHTKLLLSKKAKAGDCFDIFLSSFTGIQNYHLSFLPSLKSEDEKTLKLYYDIKTLYDTLRILEKTDDNYIMLLADLTKACNLLDMRIPYSDEYYDGIKKAHGFLSKKYYSEKKEDLPKVFCVGHTHIDIAWLWTVRVTRDKAVRSFSTALELMKKYPEYTFMSSQPQLYKFVKEDAPEVYEEIRKRIKEGRWEAEGGTFLEPDCNLTSGESLVRQFVYGKKFFKDEFGIDSRILWLPDVFGYSAALPQIMKKCGIDYFMTTKISWNEVNELPYDTFYWRGIDGTKMLSYFITTRDYVSKTRDTKTSNEFCTEFSTNYNGYINPSEMMGAWQRYQQKDINRNVLCSYGYGDGGGGPTEEMIETEKRMEYGLPGCPVTENTHVSDFFTKLSKNLRDKKVPVWSGELYLEYHRGTYTSMAENKRNNRKSEFSLLNIESLGAIAKNLGSGFPKSRIDLCWEKVMRNQFHDILPGSAVKEVYDDSRREYAEVFSECMDIKREFETTISKNIKGICVFNPSGISVTGIAKTENEKAKDVSLQLSAEGKYLVYADNVSPKGFKYINEEKKKFEKIKISEKKVETPFAVIEFNEKGQITYWYDKDNERNILKEKSKANVLMAYDDRPHKYDNWNIFDYYREKSWEIDDFVSAKVTEKGPIRYALEFKWNYMSSSISEKIYFYPFTKRVDFVFTSDWKENQTLLKTLFPVEVNTDEATYDIQYGNVVRKTHRNTSWDTAKFETVMHKWVDVSEGGFGVSFLNDCKYGVSIEENDVGISLIKCGNYPNPKADRGHHECIYSVYPHSGTWKEADTVSESYLLNNPLSVIAGCSDENKIGEIGIVSTGSKNIVTEVIKPSEKGDSVIIRAYEYMNKKCNVTFDLTHKANEIWLCDMLENRIKLLGKDTDSFICEFGPFEINTIEIA